MREKSIRLENVGDGRKVVMLWGWEAVDTDS